MVTATEQMVTAKFHDVVNALPVSPINYHLLPNVDNWGPIRNPNCRKIRRYSTLHVLNYSQDS